MSGGGEGIRDAWSFRRGEKFSIEPLSDHRYAVRVVPVDHPPGPRVETCETGPNAGQPVESAAIIAAEREGPDMPWVWLLIAPGSKEWIGFVLFGLDHQCEWMGMEVIL